MADSLWTRTRSASGLLCAVYCATTFAGCWLVAGTPWAMLMHPNYPILILFFVALLNLAALLIPLPLGWVISSGFLLIVLNPTVAGATGKIANGAAHVGYILALAGDLLSFVASSPSSSTRTSTVPARFDEPQVNPMLGIVALLVLVGEVLICIKGVVDAQALWLLLVYTSANALSFSAGRSFAVFAATVLAPRYYLLSMLNSGMLFVGMIVCSLALVLLVVDFVNERYQAEATQPLTVSVFDPREYFSPINFLRLLFTMCGIVGAFFVWFKAGTQTIARVQAAVLLLAVILNHVSVDTKFGRLVVTAIALVFSGTYSGMPYAQGAGGIEAMEVSHAGWLLLVLATMGSTLMALPIFYEDMPSIRHKHVLFSIVFGLLLIVGSFVVPVAKFQSYNAALSLGLLGFVLLLGGSYGWREGVEVVFHSAILLVATFTPANLAIFPWIALVCILAAYAPSTDDYTDVEVGDPVSGGFWRPINV